MTPGDDPSARSVLLVVENLPVPYDRRVWQEALALKAANFQVSVLSPATSLHPRLSEELEGIHVYRYPILIEGRGYAGLITEYLWSFLCIFLGTLIIAFRRGFKVIMIANPPDIFFPIMAFWRLLGKRTVFDHHDLTPELFATKFRRSRSIILTFFHFAERRMLRIVHKVISTNESYREIALRRGSRMSEDVIIVRNAPSANRFSVRPAEPELRRSARYLLVFLGEIGEQDGVDIFIRAIKQLRNRLGPNSVHAVLMGGGPHCARIIEYAQEQGVTDAITFTGRADNETICRVLSSADLAVDPCPDSPHARVSTATKIMEYMFFSLPIVAFDLIETRRSGGDAVCYARIDDEAHFVSQILDLLEDEPRRTALGHRARQRLESTLSWKVQSRGLVSLFEALIAPQAVAESPASPESAPDETPASLKPEAESPGRGS